MEKNCSEHELIRWFDSLPLEVRYRFSSTWMKDESDGISIAKLAEFLTGDKSHSEQLVKGFRSYDLVNDKLKIVWRPEQGFTQNDVHQICHAINAYRDKHGRADKVQKGAFYRRAWDELHSQYSANDSASNNEVEQAIPTVAIESVATDTGWRTSLDAGGLSTHKLAIAFGLALGIVLLIVFSGNETDEPIKAPLVYSQYLPGNVVQFHQTNKVEHYLSAKACYPELEPQPKLIQSEHLPPLTLTALVHKRILLPSLPAGEQAFVSGVIRFDGLKQWSLTKGKINLGMSDTCMASMQQVVDFGMNIENYAIIKQTYVADVIHYHLVLWAQITDLEAKRLTDNITAQFTDGKIEVTDGHSEQGVTRHITISGPRAVAYISQPISARISM